MTATEKGFALNWKALCKSFAARFVSITEQTEISNRLDAISLEDVRSNEDGDYTALGKLTQRIDQLASMRRPKDRDDEAKVRCLTCAVNGTQWGLSAL